MSLCVFDLDSTLGDFRVVDYFGLLLDPKCILGFPDIPKETLDTLKNAIDSYDSETKAQLLYIRDSFEKAMEKYNHAILRPKLQSILAPLVKEYKKKKVQGFIIYSNNANLYSLEYAGRAIERMFKTPKLFLKYIDRRNSIRNQHDGAPEGNRLKTVNTIKKAAPEATKILFMDDLEHEDLLNSPNVTYIHVPSYICPLTNDILDDIWDIFIQILEDSNFKDEFMDLYHIKTYLHCNTLEDMKGKYIRYSHSIEPNIFHENMTMIKNKIAQFIGSKGGKTRRFKRSRKNAYKQKHAYSE